MPLTPDDLHTLRNVLIEHEEIHAEREHLSQIARYLKAQRVDVSICPSAVGIRIAVKRGS